MRASISRFIQGLRRSSGSDSAPPGTPQPAEGVGFEPTVPLPVHQLSGLANSATLAPLRVLVDRECYPAVGSVGRGVEVLASDVAGPTRLAVTLRIRCSGGCKTAAESLQNSG